MKRRVLGFVIGVCILGITGCMAEEQEKEKALKESREADLTIMHIDAKISTILAAGEASVDIFTVNDEMVSEFKHKQYLYVQRSLGHLSKSRSTWKRADSGCTAASVYKAGHEYCCLAVCSEPFFKKTGQCGKIFAVCSQP